MAGRIVVTAGIAGAAVVVSGIIGVVTATDIGARADNAGSRVSVAKIEVAAPTHPAPFPVTSADSDIPAPAAPETVTVPAPEPREVLTQAKTRKSTAAKSEAAQKASGNGQQGSGQTGNTPAGKSKGGDRNGAGQGQDQQGVTGQVPQVLPKMLQRQSVIAEAPVHGNGKGMNNGAVKGADNGRGHDKTSHTQSRESSPAHRG